MEHTHTTQPNRRRYSTLALWLALLALLLSGRAAPASADGNLSDGALDVQYGASMFMDIDFDGWTTGGNSTCDDTAERGDLIELDAHYHTNNRWYFGFVIDSSHDLNSTAAGSYYGNSAAQLVSYFITIENGGGNTINFGAGGAWQRDLSVAADYFIAFYPSGANSLSATLYDSSRNAVGGATVNTQIVYTGTRRFVEVEIANDGGSGLNSNSPIRAAAFSHEGFDGGNVIDSINAGGHSCELGTPSVALSAIQPTAANCKATGRPTDSGTNDRQCSSNARRDAITPLSTAVACNVPNLGITIDGNIDAEYTHLVEAEFAGPYAGGSNSASDFDGESAAFQYYANPDSDPIGSMTGALRNLYSDSTNGANKAAADLEQVYGFTDNNYLYLIVRGPGALGGAGEFAGAPNDLTNLFIAIDIDGVGGSVHDIGSASRNAAEQRDHPANRRINFRGWSPDYIVELVWAGADTTTNNVNLYQSGGSLNSWSNINTFGVAESTNTATSAIDGYLGRAIDFSNPGDTKGTYEFAIPWADLGGNPGSSTAIRVGVYTTADSNAIGAGGNDDFDVFDQAPGVGQGTIGLGAHEQIGDDPTDGDSAAQTGAESDSSLDQGQTDPAFNVEPGSDRQAEDVDTIEEYFVFTADPDHIACAFDFGDNPDSGAGVGVLNYSTTISDNGAYHNTSGGALRLGACVDSDNGTLQSATAAADDAGAADTFASGTGEQVRTYGSCATAGDDEDGVRFVTPVIPGHSACVEITATSGDYVNAFIDWGTADASDGTLDPVTFTSPTVGTNLQVAVGVTTACFDVPAAIASGGTLYSRFRISSAGGLAATGGADDGEVEDYALPLVCVGNYVWNDDGDDVQNGGDAPLASVVVNLLWGGADGALATSGDNVTYSTTTDSTGRYHFCGLLPDANADTIADDYQVVLPNIPGTLVTADSGGDDALDSDGSVSGNAATGPVFNVALPTAASDTAGNDLSGAGNSGFADDQDDLTFDFGVLAIAIGNRVWCEVGVPDSDYDHGTDTGLNGVSVELYAVGDTPGSDTPIATTTTAGGGLYQFLLLEAGDYFVAVVNSTINGGECTGTFGSDFGSIGSTSADPRSADSDDDGATTGGYTLSAPFTATANAATAIDSGDPDGYPDASSFMMIDFGFAKTPNAIELATFTADAAADGTVTVSWETASEIDAAGFNIWRGRQATGSDRMAVNGGLIAAAGISGLGSSYSYDDAGVPSGTWHYWLEAIDVHGVSTFHGPIAVVVTSPTAVALGMTQAGAAKGVAVASLLAVLFSTLLSLWAVRSRRRA